MIKTLLCLTLLLAVTLTYNILPSKDQDQEIPKVIAQGVGCNRQMTESLNNLIQKCDYIPIGDPYAGCLREGMSQIWGGFWVVHAIEKRAKCYLDYDLVDGCAFGTYKQHFRIYIWGKV